MPPPPAAPPPARRVAPLALKLNVAPLAMLASPATLKRTPFAVPSAAVTMSDALTVKVPVTLYCLIPPDRAPAVIVAPFQVTLLA